MRRWVFVVLSGFILLGQQPTVAPPGPITITIDGKLIGTTSTALKFLSGTGVVITGVALPSGEIDVTASMNTAAVVSWGNVLSAAYCPATGGVSAYTCELQVAPASYTPGMVVELNADAPCSSGNCTLNVHNLGVLSIRTNDGTNAAATFKAGTHILSYDSSVNVWRLLL